MYKDLIESGGYRFYKQNVKMSTRPCEDLVKTETTLRQACAEYKELANQLYPLLWVLLNVHPNPEHEW
jgi:hypothetical protein